jgi:hypothetical protein
MSNRASLGPYILIFLETRERIPYIRLVAPLGLEMHLYTVRSPLARVHLQVTSRFSPQPHDLYPHRHRRRQASSLLLAAGSQTPPPSRTIAAALSSPPAGCEASSPSRAPSSPPPSVEPPSPQAPPHWPQRSSSFPQWRRGPPPSPPSLGSGGVKAGGWGIERAALPPTARSSVDGASSGRRGGFLKLAVLDAGCYTLIPSRSRWRVSSRHLLLPPSSRRRSLPPAATRARAIDGAGLLGPRRERIEVESKNAGHAGAL